MYIYIYFYVLYICVYAHKYVNSCRVKIILHFAPFPPQRAELTPFPSLRPPGAVICVIICEHTITHCVCVYMCMCVRERVSECG